jgi:MFS family permease
VGSKGTGQKVGVILQRELTGCGAYRLSHSVDQVPLLGPAIGPVLGGLLTDWFNWRATFYFLVIFGGLMWFAFLLLFKDTFRRERSATYQMAVKRARAAAAKRRLEHREMRVAMSNGGSKDGSDPTPSGTVTPDISADDIKLTLTDVNPLPPLYLIFKRKNNLAILLASGWSFPSLLTYH